jgi:hypothetical protein
MCFSVAVVGWGGGEGAEVGGAKRTAIPHTAPQEQQHAACIQQHDQPSGAPSSSGGSIRTFGELPQEGDGLLRQRAVLQQHAQHVLRLHSGRKAALRSVPRPARGGTQRRSRRAPTRLAAAPRGPPASCGGRCSRRARHSEPLHMRGQTRRKPGRPRRYKPCTSGAGRPGGTGRTCSAYCAWCRLDRSMSSTTSCSCSQAAKACGARRGRSGQRHRQSVRPVLNPLLPGCTGCACCTGHACCTGCACCTLDFAKLQQRGQPWHPPTASDEEHGEMPRAGPPPTDAAVLEETQSKHSVPACLHVWLQGRPAEGEPEQLAQLLDARQLAREGRRAQQAQHVLPLQRPHLRGEQGRRGPRGSVTAWECDRAGEREPCAAAARRAGRGARGCRRVGARQAQRAPPAQRLPGR